MPVPSLLPSLGDIAVTPARPVGTWAMVTAVGDIVNRGEQTEVVLVPLGGGQVQRVARYRTNTAGLSGSCRGPAASPDGRRLAITVLSERPGGCLLAIIDIASGNVRPVPTDGSTWDWFPAWSPDGSQIAYIRGGVRPPRNLDSFEVWIVRSDGSDPRPLYVDPGHRDIVQTTPPGAMLTWSADGANIYVPFLGRVLTIEVPSGRTTAAPIRVWGEMAAREKSPHIAASFLGPGDIGVGLDVFDQPGGPRRTIVAVEQRGDLTGLRWRPGADDILYMRGSRTTGTIEITSLAGQMSSPLGSLIVGCTNWLPNGSGIVYCPLDESKRFRSLRTLQLDGRADREIWRFTPDTSFENSIRLAGVDTFVYR